MKTEFKIEYEKIESENKKGIPVVVVAGGSSTRMNGVDKIFAEILGIPVIVRTLLAFQNSAKVSGIVVVTKKESICDIRNLSKQYMIDKLFNVVEGGNTRQASVLNGINAFEGYNGNILIHDGARPLVSDAVIDNVVDMSSDFKCVICGTSPYDTIKSIDKGVVKETIDRNTLFCVQTPQRVELGIYRELLTKNFDGNYTDDASFFEAAGYTVGVTAGDRSNIKITNQLDLKIAESILSDI